MFISNAAARKLLHLGDDTLDADAICYLAGMHGHVVKAVWLVQKTVSLICKLPVQVVIKSYTKRRTSLKKVCCRGGLVTR